MHESESEVVESCPTLSDPMDCGPPASSVHGIFQARVLLIIREMKIQITIRHPDTPIRLAKIKTDSCKC